MQKANGPGVPNLNFGQMHLNEQPSGNDAASTTARKTGDSLTTRLLNTFRKEKPETPETQAFQASFQAAIDQSEIKKLPNGPAKAARALLADSWASSGNTSPPTFDKAGGKELVQFVIKQGGTTVEERKQLLLAVTQPLIPHIAPFLGPNENGELIHLSERKIQAGLEAFRIQWASGSSGEFHARIKDMKDHHCTSVQSLATAINDYAEQLSGSLSVAESTKQASSKTPAVVAFAQRLNTYCAENQGLAGPKPAWSSPSTQRNFNESASDEEMERQQRRERSETMATAQRNRELSKVQDRQDALGSDDDKPPF